MSELRARLRKWPQAAAGRLPVQGSRVLAGLLIVLGIVLPFFFPQTSGFLNATIIAIAYAVMSLGLNVVVGFAGLLDLGYVAFYALGAYSLGWFGSGFFFRLHVHVLVSPVASVLGVHLNFLLILIAAAQMSAAAIRIRMKLRCTPGSVPATGETSTWICSLKKNPEPNHPSEYAPSA